MRGVKHQALRLKGTHQQVPIHANFRMTVLDDHARLKYCTPPHIITPVSNKKWSRTDRRPDIDQEAPGDQK